MYRCLSDRGSRDGDDSFVVVSALFSAVEVETAAEKNGAGVECKDRTPERMEPPLRRGAGLAVGGVEEEAAS